LDLGLSGKITVVQAASRGLGRAIARELAAEGAHVAICARGAEALLEAAAAIRDETGAEVLAVPADVTVAAERNAFFERVEAELGPPSILVCNAGGPPPRGFDQTTPEDWNAAIAANFLSAVESCRRLLPAMRAARFGRIVLVTSLSVKQPIPGLILSNAARAGVTGFAKTLAGEVAGEGITVNCACPGTHRTARVTGVLDSRASRGADRAELERSMVAGIPVGRIGEPAEFAAAVAFLCSERASFITGVSLAVDGGAHRGLL
jgi:3-oxoacyl-[acyl-carrier protein] reductase